MCLAPEGNVESGVCAPGGAFTRNMSCVSLHSRLEDEVMFELEVRLLVSVQYIPWYVLLLFHVDVRLQRLTDGMVTSQGCSAPTTQ